MLLDLRKIIDMPGASVTFECDLNPDDLYFPSIKEYIGSPKASGTVFNEAGILRMTGSAEADMLCTCDRCGKEFESSKTTEIDVVLAEEDPNANPGLFLIEGDEIDVTEVCETCFNLDMETKFLCGEDCKGLCPTCGKNLNDGPCGCQKERDPRFAVLEQLLDK